MACTRILGGFICSRGAALKPKPCTTCGAPSAYLCDGPRPPQSRKRAETCDAPICDEHATEIGPNKHHCPTCHTQAVKAQRQAAGVCQRCGEAPHGDWRDCPRIGKRRGSANEPSGSGEWTWFTFPPPHRWWANEERR